MAPRRSTLVTAFDQDDLAEIARLADSEESGLLDGPDPDRDNDGAKHRQYLKRVFAELRKEGLRELEEGDTIFEVKGNQPQTRLFRRFGSSLDRVMYTVCRFIATWDIICVVPMLCYCNADSQRVETVRQWISLRAFEITMVAFYFFGVVLRFFTSIVDVVRGEEHVELKEIFSRHVTSWTLWADVVSLAGNLWWVWPSYWFIAGFRLLRVWRLPSNTNHTYLITTGRTESPTGMLMELVLALWLVAHVFGCIWFFADSMQMQSEMQQLEAHHVKESAFKEIDELAEHILESFARKTAAAYLEYMKDGAAMLVGWNGPEPQAAVFWTSSEMAFWVVVAPCAVMYMTALQVWLMKIVDRLMAAEQRHHDLVNKLEPILLTLRIPDQMKRRVLQYHSFLSLHNIDSAAYDALFTGLSSNLHVETKLFLFESLLLKASFFEDVPPQHLMNLVSSLEEAVFSPGDMIVHKGQMGEELFFIMKGSAEVLLDDDASQVVSVKCVGEYFGEIALVLDQVRSAWIRAKTFCVLAKLVRTTLNKVLETVPEAKQRMVDKIMKVNKKVFIEPATPGSKMDIQLRDAQKLKTPREPQAEPRLSYRGCSRQQLAKIEGQVVDLQKGQRDISECVRKVNEAVQQISGHLSFAFYSQ